MLSIAVLTSETTHTFVSLDDPPAIPVPIRLLGSRDHIGCISADTVVTDKASWLTATFISVIVYLGLSLFWPPTESLYSGNKSSHENEEVDVDASAMVDRESGVQYDKYSGQKVRILDE